MNGNASPTAPSTATNDGQSEEGNVPTGPLAETVTHERRWATMFERLKKYKEKHGNCLVPNRYAEDTQLGSWVSAQRRQYKIVTSGGAESAAMTPERAKKLSDIGFEWSTTNPRNVPWERRYEELRNFVSDYGHAEVPMRWEENPQLSNWVSKQRHQYKLMQSNRPSRLNAERVSKLNEVGFVWEASRRRLVDEGGDGSEDEGSDSERATSRKRAKLASRAKAASNKEKPDTLPTFAEGKPGRFGMDPPAPLETVMPMPFIGQNNNSTLPPPGTMEFAQAAQLAAAGQNGVLQANFGLWAAMAAGQAAAGFMPPQAVAAAAAAGAAMNPQLFMQMGSMMPAFGGAIQGMQFPSVIPPGLSAQQQQQQQEQSSHGQQQQQTSPPELDEEPKDGNPEEGTEQEGGNKDQKDGPDAGLGEVSV